MRYVQIKCVRGATSEYSKLNGFHLNTRTARSWTRGPSEYNHRYSLYLVADEHGRVHSRAERRLWLTQYHFAEMNHSLSVRLSYSLSYTHSSICMRNSSAKGK
jgi:hypothetical protein